MGDKIMMTGIRSRHRALTKAEAEKVRRYIKAEFYRSVVRVRRQPDGSYVITEYYQPGNGYAKNGPEPPEKSRSLWGSLTPKQKKAATTHDEDEVLGSPEFKRD